MLDKLLCLHGILQCWIVLKTSQCIQQLRDSVVGEDGELVYVVELSITLTLEASPDVCNENLCALQNSDTFFLLEINYIVEAVEVFC